MRGHVEGSEMRGEDFGAKKERDEVHARLGIISS